MTLCCGFWVICYSLWRLADDSLAVLRLLLASIRDPGLGEDLCNEAWTKDFALLVEGPVSVVESGGTISDCLGFWYLTDTSWMAWGLLVPLAFTCLCPILVSVNALLKLIIFAELDALLSSDLAKILRLVCFSPDFCC